jgi:arabinan endo-1,5-alpha-L-arabinosidase
MRLHRLTRVLTALAGVVALVAPLSGAAGEHADRRPGAPGRPGVQVLQPTGDVRTHDPALVRHGRDGDWFVFSTGDPQVAGGTVQVRRSGDLTHWESAGTVWSEIPAWVQAAVPGVENLWAPEVLEHDGVYYLYYSASTFGSNRSVIGLATNATLDPDDPDYRWVDRGEVTSSTTDDDYNAIDPGIVEDEHGEPWMAFGSFWSGIRMLRLEWPSGKPAAGQDEPLRLADRHVPPNAVEAPYVVRHGGWFYLFVSFDFCCRGTDSTYKIAVGRSRDVTGPYVDRLGTPLLHGGGTVLLSENGDMVGPGGQSLYGDVLAHHYYDAGADGDFRLGLRRIAWDADGWPRLTDVPRP